ncbi:PQQ-dependent sugar dehydrogenase [Aequorivita echinoideorum]|uniref:PQQ-dependent sugar dehydrogenase n=1 Tax=Aequorivita echinoideorum TaxID=1549647 RepID=A0ABS5S5T4_9FLAO|nr:PQQ-dependent sugar dehydrogenase [Aequorivita echinoideorum]MBT0608582.1 PQQ-dependent sugar dehydrogenase [Aequorivita echinoideorum]
MKKLILFFPLLFCAIGFSQDVDIELFKNGFSSPLHIQNAGDERLFVVEQGGRIKIIQADGSINATPFLNISSSISSGGEQGLLGLAFHPDYANNGFFYVNYTKPNGDTQISRFSVDSGNPDLADAGSELPLLDYAQPFTNHNGGNLAFGPDGFLYISSGDGGSGGDPGNRAQNIELLLGKLLRIDVDNPSGGNNYGIPADNPFASNPSAAQEIWAYGLRNPWRFSFDFTANNIWIGDVGQGEVEELDRASVTEAGLNYGWRCYEGSQTFNTANCPPASDLTFPFGEYSSGSGSGNCSVTGGYVYRGSVYSDIQGLYFYADYCSGLIGTIDDAGNMQEYGNFNGNWVSFGEDVNKELYIVDISSGSIYKVLGGTLATEDFNLADVQIFPNPTKDNFTISMKNEKISSIEIVDLKGSVLISEKNLSVSDVNISASNLNSGIYVAKIESENGATAIKKLVIN